MDAVVVMSPLAYLFWSGALNPFLLAGAAYAIGIWLCDKYLPRFVMNKYGGKLLVLLLSLPLLVLWLYPKLS